MIEKDPYLQELGITAVELLPITAFDNQDAPPGRTNDWGYAPLAYFAPHAAYAARREGLQVLDEFRDLVNALHRAGIEVILDVVFNHTAEGPEHDPTLCLRGIDDATYYLRQEDGVHYADHSGIGNTLNAVGRCRIRRSYGVSKRIPCSPARSSSLRRGMLLVSIRSGASLATRDASGTDAFATTRGTSSEVRAEHRAQRGASPIG